MRPRPPGGGWPEGWEYFCPVRSLIFFAIPEEEEGYYRVLALCPCKVPLDPSGFDAKRLHLEQMHDFKRDDSSPERSTQCTPAKLSDEALRRQERERRTPDRFFEPWSPDILCRDFGEYAPFPAQQWRIRAVINLCATERYYDPDHVRDNHAEYVWLKTTGGGKLPSRTEVQQVGELWNDLLKRYGLRVAAQPDLRTAIQRLQQPLPVVALHCTHGVNRTGFFFAALVLLFADTIISPSGKILPVTAAHALELFAVTRGHQVNREELRQHLMHSFPRSKLDRSFNPLRTDSCVLQC